MHDPNVVAHVVVLPIPRRIPPVTAPSEPRWSFTRRRRTNTENLGEPVYPWWRPAGWRVLAAGRRLGLYRLATIWHVEPDGQDSGTVCKHWENGRPRRAWRWHVHHWSIQVHPLQSWRARLFDRCSLCGRKGSPNISHGWSSSGGVGWRKWRSREGLYHRECSELVSRRQSAETDARLIRWLVAGLAVSADTTEIEMVDRLTGSTVTDDVMPFHARRRLHLMLGYERDSAYRLRNACTGKRHCRAQVHIHGCFADVDGAVCRDPHEHTRTPAETVTR